MVGADMLSQLTASPELIISFALGLAVHVGQKLYTNKIALRDYLNGHGGRTLLSLSSLITSFCAISLMIPDANYLTYFLCGYSVDSLMNKAPISLEGLLKHQSPDKMHVNKESKEVRITK